jgi:S-adenosylmethionine synthetase
MCLIFSRILGLPHAHITPEAEPIKAEGAPNRPRDTQLYTGETERLGVEGGLGLSLFEEWWTERLKS